MIITTIPLQTPATHHDSCEDSTHPVRPSTGIYPVCRVCIADGVSSGYANGVFAGLICEAFGEGRLNWFDGLEDDEAIARCRALWYDSAASAAQMWYEKALVERGPACTFLGVEFHEDANGGGTYIACAIGDACLAHVRRGRVIKFFPIGRSAEFTDMPPAVCGDPRPDAQALIGGIGHTSPHIEGSIEITAGRWQYGDEFWIASDALAKWMLATIERGATPWSSLRCQVEGPENFGSWVRFQRAHGGLDDDDTTLLHVRIQDDSKAVAAMPEPVGVPDGPRRHGTRGLRRSRAAKQRSRTRCAR